MPSRENEMLKAEWEKRRALVEEGLVRELHEDEAFDARLAESMKYSFGVLTTLFPRLFVSGARKWMMNDASRMESHDLTVTAETPTFLEMSS